MKITGVRIILRRIEIASPEFSQNIYNITVLNNADYVICATVGLELAKRHKPGHLTCSQVNLILVSP